MTSALWSLGPSLFGLCTSDRGPWSLWSFLLSVSRSFEVRGPRSFRSSLRRRRFPAFSDVRALVSRSFVVGLCTSDRGPWSLWSFYSRSLGPSRSEVRGPLGVLYDVGAFRLSPTSALWSLRSFVVRTLYF